MKIQIFVAVALGCVTGPALAWQGILSESRAIDWSEVGVAGGIRERSTVCQTFNPDATTAQINSAISSCPDNTVVYLNAGTYNLGGGKIEILRSNITLRGAGADQTKLVFSGSSNCGGTAGNICFGSGQGWIPGGYSTSPQNSATWSGPYTKGTTTIMLSSTANLVPGRIIELSQLNDTADGDGMYVCNTGGVCAYTTGGGDVWNNNRHQREMKTVVAVNGNQVTLSSPLYHPNWRSDRSPAARWNNYTTIRFSGVEDLSIDRNSFGYEGGSAISLIGTADSWVKGVRIVDAGRSFIQPYQTARLSLVDNYFYGSKGGVSQNYGIEVYGASSDILIQNNIFQHITAPVNINDGGVGIVVGYNFTIDNFRADVTSLMSSSYHLHSPGVSMALLEGNSGTAFVQDNWYGTTHFVTLFRNHLYGDICSDYITGCPKKTGQTWIMQVAAYSSFFNFVGNVLGRPDVNTVYDAGGTSCSNDAIWCLGYSHATGGVTDAQTRVRAMRWGNWDTVTNATRWEASEVPSGLPQFANPVPATQTLPASFYLDQKPSWFGAIPWPVHGPDVSGGNISGFNSHAHKNPARACWESLSTDPRFGSSYDGGQVRQFNAARCYGRDAIPEAPSSLSVS